MVSNKKYNLPAKERIKKKKDFADLYKKGRALFSSGRKIKAVFLMLPGEPGLKMAAAVSGKQGLAVRRNRAKRLIKDSFRLHKEIIAGICRERNATLYVVFSPFSAGNNIMPIKKRSDVDEDIVEVLEKIKKII